MESIINLILMRRNFSMRLTMPQKMTLNLILKMLPFLLNLSPISWPYPGSKTSPFCLLSFPWEAVIGKLLRKKPWKNWMSPILWPFPGKDFSIECLFPSVCSSSSKMYDINWICVSVHGIKPLCTIYSYSDNFES